MENHGDSLGYEETNKILKSPEKILELSIKWILALGKKCE